MSKPTLISTLFPIGTLVRSTCSADSEQAQCLAGTIVGYTYPKQQRSAISGTGVLFYETSAVVEIFVEEYDGTCLKQHTVYSLRDLARVETS